MDLSTEFLHLPLPDCKGGLSLCQKPTQDADALFHLPLPEADTTPSGPTEFNISQIYALPVTSVLIQSCSRKDPIHSKVHVLGYTKSGWPSTYLKLYHLRKLEMTIESGCLLWTTRVIVPHNLQKIVLKELYLKPSWSVKDEGYCQELRLVARPGQRDRKHRGDLPACQVVKQAPAKAQLHP